MRRISFQRHRTESFVVDAPTSSDGRIPFHFPGVWEAHSSWPDNDDPVDSSSADDDQSMAKESSRRKKRVVLEWIGWEFDWSEGLWDHWWSSWWSSRREFPLIFCSHKMDHFNHNGDDEESVFYPNDLFTEEREREMIFNLNDRCRKNLFGHIEWIQNG